MAEIDFTKFEELKERIEYSDNDDAKKELEEVRSEHSTVFETAGVEDDSLVTVNDLKLAEEALERLVEEHQL